MQAVICSSSQLPTDLIAQLSAGVTQLYQGAQAVNTGTKNVSAGLQSLEDGTVEAFPVAAAGIKALNDGFDQLTSYDKQLNDGAKNLKTAGKQSLAHFRISNPVQVSWQMVLRH